MLVDKTYNKNKLRDLIIRRFNVDELSELCFELHIPSDEFTPRRSIFARELIEYFERHNKLPVLLELLRRKRPDENWPLVPIYISSSTPLYHLDRSEELRAIHNILQDNRVLVLSGIAGIGKTQLAIDYAKKYQAHFPGGIFEISADKSITQGLAELSNRLDPNATDQSEGGQVDTSLKYLKGGLSEKKPQQLIIVNDLAHLSELTIPVEGQQISLFELPCKLLVTTDTTNGIDYPRLEIPRLPRDQALAFFFHHLGRLLDPSNSEDIEEYIAARQLCGLLGYLPLAIKLVANELRNKSIADYRNDLRGTYQGLARRVNKILESHWNALRQSNSDAYDILNYIGQFKSDLISIDQLELLSGLSPEKFQEALEAIQRSSLMENVILRRIEVHSLVRQFAAQQPTRREAEGFRLLMERDAISFLDQAQSTDRYLSIAMVAGECLFELTWIARELRAKVLDVLSNFLESQELSGAELRKVSILRMRVHWLIESSPLSPDEMLTSLDPIMRLANSPIDREALLRDIDKLLTLNISIRQRVRFHLYQAQLFAQLFEFLEIDIKQSEAGQSLIKKAQDTIGQAQGNMGRLTDEEQNDQQLWAQIFQFSANIGRLQAESIEAPSKQKKKLQATLEIYKKAAKAVGKFGHDPILTGIIYSEMAHNFASLKDFAEAEKFYQRAWDSFDNKKKGVLDNEVYVFYKAHLLIKYAYMYWDKVKSKGSENYTHEDCFEYEKAFNYTREAINLLQGYQNGTRNLAVAYLNAGDYLFEQQQIAMCDKTNLGGDPLSYWTKAKELSERYGYWNIFQHVKEAISQLEQ